MTQISNNIPKSSSPRKQNHIFVEHICKMPNYNLYFFSYCIITANIFSQAGYYIIRHKQPSKHPFLQTNCNLPSFFTIFHMSINRYPHEEFTPKHSPPIAFLNITPEIKQQLVGQLDISSSACYKLTLALPIQCKNNQHHSFIKHLLVALAQSTFFQYMAHLSDSSQGLSGQTQFPSSTGSSYFITYSAFQTIDTQSDRFDQIKQTFRARTSKMHQILNALKSKYQIQTKLNFWVKRFKDLLQASDKHEAKQKERAEQKSSQLSQMSSSGLAEKMQFQNSQMLNKQ